MYDDFGDTFEYNYDEYFPTKKLLWDVGRRFHEQLKGQDAYINNDIILNIDEDNQMIHLTQWKSSKLKVRVECKGNERNLVFLSGRYDWIDQPFTKEPYPKVSRS